ncbi:MAG: RHS repeat-associated core domain-containing protein, partial [Acidimicrobiales bacterium]
TPLRATSFRIQPALESNWSSGDIAGTMTYTSYGSPCVTCSMSSPFGYQGAYTDATGLVYLVNRYYDPGTAQFLNVDPDVAQTGQPYEYADDDPVNEADPSGLCAWCIVDPWSHANPLYEAAASGSTISTVIEYADPAYAAINGYYSEAQAAENPCSSDWTIAGDALEGVLGTVGTVGGAAALGDAVGDVLADGLGPFDEVGAVNRGSPALDPANQEMTVQEYASQFMKASSARQIPGEYMNMSVRDALASGNTTVRKMLTNLRTLKGS